jgi:hypothetical protein
MGWRFSGVWGVVLGICGAVVLVVVGSSFLPS